MIVMTSMFSFPTVITCTRKVSVCACVGERARERARERESERARESERERERERARERENEGEGFSFPTGTTCTRLEFKVYRRSYHSTLGSRVIKKEKYAKKGDAVRIQASTLGMWVYGLGFRV